MRQFAGALIIGMGLSWAAAILIMAFGQPEWSEASLNFRCVVIAAELLMNGAGICTGYLLFGVK